MFIVCERCPFGLEVMGELKDVSDLRSSNQVCPECGGPCTKSKFIDQEARGARTIRRLNPQEAHLVFEGMGFPEERACVDEIVAQELTTKRVVTVRGVTIPNTARTVVHELVLEDGTTMFFGASSHGAVVYRIRKPNPYSSQVK